MGFVITVQNDGVDATVDVNEQINLNQSIQVFSGFIGGGTSVQVACQGSPPKDFSWTHHGSGLSGGPDTVGDGGILRVS